MLNTVKALINQWNKGIQFSIYNFSIYNLQFSTIFYTENKNMFINHNQLFRTREKKNKNIMFS